MVSFARALLGIFCALMASPLSAQARGLRVAIFDFELIDTSLEGATNGPRADETARLVRLGGQLRGLVANPGKRLNFANCPGWGEGHHASPQAFWGCVRALPPKLRAQAFITVTLPDGFY